MVCLAVIVCSAVAAGFAMAENDRVFLVISLLAAAQWSWAAVQSVRLLVVNTRLDEWHDVVDAWHELKESRCSVKEGDTDENGS